ncbi:MULTISPECIES: NUDIX domain-containing protein [unclassified Psychrobacter]|uniref:NUDIX domain-containing protein n=1 Tax=unclassified Psychrobacter TaxID=196806 RepID=UPI00071E854E|nr:MULTISPECIES: NUDIX domain-containing protein [unclassified Psychrobacter]OLF39433.1 NUDIX hydrolase [Psychrobacter sp. Cmf 22.2]
MLNQSTKQPINNTSVTVNVAVAVIHYKDKYLLGFRDQSQHQGNRYEFIGGKIDAHETASQALVREVAEESGIVIHNNTIVKLGRLHHDYGDKKVSLQVYRIELTAQQYDKYRHHGYGLEGQALTWVNKSELLAGDYNLPAANKTILEWLRLPPKIAITYPLSYFHAYLDTATAWLQYHQDHIEPDAWVYIRVKDTRFENIAEQLMSQRPDIQVIVPNDVSDHYLTTNHQILAHHLTQTSLLQWSHEVKDTFASDQLQALLHPLIVSCHDADSICAANKLANSRLERQEPPVIGVFLSPVLATQTHPDAKPLGWEAWSDLAALADMPVIGLGGLSPELFAQATQYGATSIAGIRQFL